jgi:hypothetical protein
MRSGHTFLSGIVWLAVCAVGAAGDGAPSGESEKGSDRYLLRYQFRPGETIRWEVLDRKLIRTKMADATQVTETLSKSVKAWRVTEVDDGGTVTFEHLVERADMRSRFSDGKEVCYNSQSDQQPPPGFEDFAASIGRPVVEVTMDVRGEILQRRRKSLRASTHNKEGQMTVPLPEEAVPVGHRWSYSHNVDQPLENGTVKKIKILQTFELKSVKTGVATIAVATKILTPIHDPALEAKLIDRELSGEVRFDVDAGRVLGLQMDLDRRVVGFAPNHPASSLHYRKRFTERLLPDAAKTAARPKPSDTAATQ